jgi:hypothetical protein
MMWRVRVACGVCVVAVSFFPPKSRRTVLFVMAKSGRHRNLAITLTSTNKSEFDRPLVRFPYSATFFLPRPFHSPYRRSVPDRPAITRTDQVSSQKAWLARGQQHFESSRSGYVRLGQYGQRKLGSNTRPQLHTHLCR